MVAAERMLRRYYGRFSCRWTGLTARAASALLCKQRAICSGPELLDIEDDNRFFVYESTVAFFAVTRSVVA
jgi:hypothetical protein